MTGLEEGLSITVNVQAFLDDSPRTFRFIVAMRRRGCGLNPRPVQSLSFADGMFYPQDWKLAMLKLGQQVVPFPVKNWHAANMQCFVSSVVYISYHSSFKYVRVIIYILLDNVGRCMEIMMKAFVFRNPVVLF